VQLLIDNSGQLPEGVTASASSSRILAPNYAKRLSTSHLKQECQKLIDKLSAWQNGAEKIYRAALVIETELLHNYHPSIFGPALNHTVCALETDFFAEYLLRAESDLIESMIR